MLEEKDIVQYYDDCEADYRLFWDLDRSFALHAGYWDSDTRSLQEALAKENKVLAEKAKIKPGEKVLDAGCGVGGSALYLAREYGAIATGITLSENQAAKARENSQRAKLAVAPEFFVMDYSRTTFPDGEFDVVWGLESVCHAADKRSFVNEAYRLLRPGGRIIVADGFAAGKEHQTQNWLKGWGVNFLEPANQFQNYLIEAGFENVAFSDITQNVLPSSRRLFWISLPAWVYSKCGELLGLRTKLQTENIKSAFHQYRAIRKGQWLYGIFYGEKK